MTMSKLHNVAGLPPLGVTCIFCRLPSATSSPSSMTFSMCERVASGFISQKNFANTLLKDAA
jgi:hypothetical protein